MRGGVFGGGGSLWAILFCPMPEGSTPIEIPKRALFKAAEVCDLAKVQPYVLRSWEAEFPELGVAKSAGAPRVYRRAGAGEGGARHAPPPAARVTPGGARPGGAGGGAPAAGGPP